MSRAQLLQYDRFLDENDWDIYYWATQEPTPTSRETAEGAGPEYATKNAGGKAPEDEPYKTTEPMTSKPEDSANIGKDGKEAQAPWIPGHSQSTEWAQTVGTFKPAYRPVPARWKNSEILSMLRRHVIENSAGGVKELDAEEAKVVNEADKGPLGKGAESAGGKGFAFMPKLMEIER